MLIYVSVKHMGNIAKRVMPSPFYLGRKPDTLRALIEESVRTCIQSYRARAKSAGAPLTDGQWENMRAVGKFAFGVHYNAGEIDEETAIATALQAVEDGLVRIFKGQDELTDLNETIAITEGDELTFVRLTMLSGRLW